MKRAFWKWMVFALCPLLLFAVLAVVVVWRSFDWKISDTTTPFQKQIPLSSGAQLLAKGVTNCGGLQGDCGTSAQLCIRWKSGVVETVENGAQFGEEGMDWNAVLLSRHAGRWELQIGQRKWTRLQERPEWK